MNQPEIVPISNIKAVVLFLLLSNITITTAKTKEIPFQMTTGRRSINGALVLLMKACWGGGGL